MADHFVLLAKRIGDVILQRCSRTLPGSKWHLFRRRHRGTGSRTNEIARYAVATGVRKREDACTTRLRRLDFLGEVVVTRRAEAMRQTAGGGIEPRCVSIVFLAEPARLPCLSIVMHQPTEMTDQKYVGVRSEVRSGHITNL